MCKSEKYKKLIVININNTYYINYSMTDTIAQEIIQFDTLGLTIPHVVRCYTAVKQKEIFE